MRVQVDETACRGNAICTVFAADVFEVGDDDIAHVLLDEISPELLPSVEAAVRGCPAGALRLVSPDADG